MACDASNVAARSGTIPGSVDFGENEPMRRLFFHLLLLVIFSEGAAMAQTPKQPKVAPGPKMNPTGSWC